MAKAAGRSVEVDTGRLTGPGKVELFWREWKAASPRAGVTVLLVHGLCEHCGRYDAVGEYFTSRGVPVLAFDLRGHGQSDGPRGHVDRFEDYVGDVMFFRDFVGARHPSDKVVLLGHSMGGLIALATAEAHSEAFACVVASAPMLGIAVKVPGWKAALGKIMAGLAPRFSMTGGIDPTLLARNQDVGRRYAADPNVGTKVTARWFVEILRGMAETMTNSTRISIPTLVLQGAADRLVSVEAARAFAERPSGGPKDFKAYDGWYHELFQEDEREVAFSAVWEWLRKRGIAK